MSTRDNDLRQLIFSDGQLSEQVKASLVATLFASPLSLAAGAVTSGVAAVAIALRTSDPMLDYLAFAIPAVGLCRTAHLLFIRSQERSVPEGLSGKAYEAGAWLFSALLGALTYLTLTGSGDPALELLAAVLSTGYAAGICSRNAGRPRIALGQLILAALPLSLALVQFTDPAWWVLAALNILFIAGMADITLKTYAAVRTALAASLAREYQWRDTLNLIPQLVWSTNADGQLDYHCDRWLKFSGLDLSQAPGEARRRLVHPDDRERVMRSWRECVQSGKPYEERYRLRHFTGEYRWMLSRGLPERDEAGSVIRWYGTCTDIHESVVSRQALIESELLHRSVLEASADCIKILELDGALTLMNAPGLYAMELESFEAVRGRNWASLWPEKEQQAATAAVVKAASGEAARFTGFCPTATGTPKWWDVLVTPIRSSGGDVRQLLCISRDVTASLRSAEQLRWASEHDPLTDLPNRRSFQNRLQAATIRAMESGGMVGLLLMDLDRFKHVNDTLGHPAGDHLLRTLARSLEAGVRAGDFVARLGGDEFVVILENVTSEEDLLAAGEAIIRSVEAPVCWDGHLLSAGASIGGALFPRDAKSANDLFNNADTALYALKASGRGGIKMFHSHMREQSQKVASQLRLARLAISERSIVPHYQPKIDLRTGQLAGFEALLRWQHPHRGLQLPETVAEAFKDYELASKIGELMQSAVFADLHGWFRQGLELQHVAINAAPAEFLRDDYAERLLSRLAAQNVPAELLQVEVTEHVFLERGSDYVARALDVLKKAGVRIALDDFGTGYSSLAHLRDFPVDVVKIDRSFVSSMEEPELGAIVTAVINLAANLRIEVVAEGVETEAQRDLLAVQGCAYAQGYLFGRAVAGDEVPTFLRSAAKAA